MFTVPGNSNPLDDLVAHTASSLVQGQLEKKAQQKKMTSIQQGLGKLSEDSSPLEWLKSIESIQGLEPEEKKNLYQFQEKLMGGKAKSAENAKAADKERATADAKKRESLALAKLRRGEQLTEEEETDLSPESQRAVYAQENKPKKGKSAYEMKALDTAHSDVLKARDVIGNVARLESLATDLRGPGGYINAARGGAEATEFNALGITSVENALKIFNPVGAIPQAKIMWIAKQMAPTASEFYDTQQGKLAAIKALASQAQNRASERIKFINEGFDEEGLAKFDAESTQLFDVVTSYELGKIKSNEQSQEEGKQGKKRPSAEGNEGRILVDQRTGKRLKSNGKEWIPVE